ncbi:hypothetical protein HZH68_013471 [Vespula germanica]|uniref:Uncharacterized protein n=1 Tax=Vespula germanica TaxID=30212 RepID=A0A834JFW7_VESGE|nr:hypothetical protein HZH68_013471 [Vespula germanica]
MQQCLRNGTLLLPTGYCLRPFRVETCAIRDDVVDVNVNVQRSAPPSANSNVIIYGPPDWRNSPHAEGLHAYRGRLYGKSLLPERTEFSSPNPLTTSRCAAVTFIVSGGERALEQAVGQCAPPPGQPLRPGGTDV